MDIDINGDGDKDDVVDLTIEYDGGKICRYQRIRWDLSYALSEEFEKNSGIVSGKSGLCR